jgi:hypothetical protein
MADGTSMRLIGMISYNLQVRLMVWLVRAITGRRCVCDCLHGLGLCGDLIVTWSCGGKDPARKGEATVGLGMNRVQVKVGMHEVEYWSPSRVRCMERLRLWSLEYDSVVVVQQSASYPACFAAWACLLMGVCEAHDDHVGQQMSRRLAASADSCHMWRPDRR